MSWQKRCPTTPYNLGEREREREREEKNKQLERKQISEGS